MNRVTKDKLSTGRRKRVILEEKGTNSYIGVYQDKLGRHIIEFSCLPSTIEEVKDKFKKDLEDFNSTSLGRSSPRVFVRLYRIVAVSKAVKI